jgi:hypothetical protein
VGQDRLNQHNSQESVLELPYNHHNRWYWDESSCL